MSSVLDNGRRMVVAEADDSFEDFSEVADDHLILGLPAQHIKVFLEKLNEVFPRSNVPHIRHELVSPTDCLDIHEVFIGARLLTAVQLVRFEKEGLEELSVGELAPAMLQHFHMHDTISYII